jgi:hypothetical protein
VYPPIFGQTGHKWQLGMLGARFYKAETFVEQALLHTGRGEGRAVRQHVERVKGKLSSFPLTLLFYKAERFVSSPVASACPLHTSTR